MWDRALRLHLLFLLTIFSICSRGHSWLLAQTGLNESYRVQHLSMNYARVFLCISVKSKTFPTLIETRWPVSYLPLRSYIYPDVSAHANENHSDCSLIQQARWSQIDSLNRLWVMDVGWKEKASNKSRSCPPKLLVYDLIRNNAEVLRIDCGKYIAPEDERLLVVKLGPQPTPCRVEKFLYFILADDPHILAYDIIEQKWQYRKLLSKKYSNVIETPFPIKPIDIAFGRHHEMLISDADGSLYSTLNASFLLDHQIVISDNAIEKRVDNEPVDIEMQHLGSLLGPSKGMMVDRGGALFYAVPKFGAIVRCEYKQNLTAEGNEIIYFTSKNVQQIFFGVEGSVWLLTDRYLKPQDHCFTEF